MQVKCGFRREGPLGDMPLPEVLRTQVHTPPRSGHLGPYLNAVSCIPQRTFAMAHQRKIAEGVFIVDPKRCTPKPKRAFDEVLSDLIWRQLQIVFTILAKRFRYIAQQSAEWRSVIEGVSRPKNKLPATLRVGLNFEGRTHLDHSSIIGRFHRKGKVLKRRLVGCGSKNRL